MRPPLLKTLAVVPVLLAAALGAAFSYGRASLPVVDGSVVVSGLSGPVQIVRDADSVPHVFASTRLDAIFGLGYVHAQDRLWQMEFQRRIGFGRLSELFGEATLPEDRFLRTVGFGRAARAQWDRLPADARAAIGAYVGGVNAFIGGHGRRFLSPEFTLLRLDPERWTGPDVLVWVKMMAWDLSANYSFELMRHDLAARVGSERIQQLLPPYPVDGLSVVGAMPAVASTPRVLSQAAIPPLLPSPHSASLDRPIDGVSWYTAFEEAFSGANGVRNLLLGGGITEALGSNNWVVDGTLTASGKPLLANDPHLATHIPSLWYLAHLSAGDFDVIGATLPGTPAVAIGRNRFIAWGETNVGADVEDLFREHITDDGRATEFRGAHEPLRIVHETISVAGGRPVDVEVRISRHGPIVSDAINAMNAAARTPLKPAPLEPLALRWTGLDADDPTIGAFLRLNEARNWTDFTAALREFVVPAQNFVYADVAGHIGYYAPGRVPIRARGDGSVPLEGWTGDAEWTGWIPFDELPHVFDPPDHFIVTANNRPVAPPYPYLIALEYPEPYRAQRITDLLRQRERLTPDDFRNMQRDTLSLHARVLLPVLLEHVRPDSALDTEAIELLRHWNFDARGDSPAAAIFEAWFLRLAPAIVGDELGPLGLKAYEGRFSYITRMLIQILRDDSAGWCDDIRTPPRETCTDAVTAALHEAVTTLARSMGPDLGRWRWDAVHHAVFPHQGLDAIGLLRPLLSRSVPNGGDWSTIDVAAVDVDRPFEQRAVPGYRQIIDLSPADDSRFIDAVGQSGHFLSRHYDDFMSDWHDVRYRRMRTERADIESGATGHLTLRPN